MSKVKNTEMIESKVGSTLTEKKNDVHTCSITGKKYEGFGNNAYPFKGRCSDWSNYHYVIPARVMGLTPDMINKMGKRFVMLIIDTYHEQGKFGWCDDLYSQMVEMSNNN